MKIQDRCKEALVQGTLLHLCVSRRPFGPKMEFGTTLVTKYNFKHLGLKVVPQTFAVTQEAKFVSDNAM